MLRYNAGWTKTSRSHEDNLIPYLGLELETCNGDATIVKLS